MSFLGIGKYDSLFKLLDTHFVLFPYLDRPVLVDRAIMAMGVSLCIDSDTQYKVKIAKMVCWITHCLLNTHNTH